MPTLTTTRLQALWPDELCESSLFDTGVLRNVLAGSGRGLFQGETWLSIIPVSEAKFGLQMSVNLSQAQMPALLVQSREGANILVQIIFSVVSSISISRV